MANNIVATSVYQLNQHFVHLTDVVKVGFPVATTVLQDCSNSPHCLLPTGKSVYSFAVTPAGDKYYFEQSFTAILALFNA